MEILPVRRASRGLNLLPAKKSFQELGATAIAFCRRHSLLLFYCGLALLALLLYHYASHTVTLYVDGEELFTAHSFSRTVEEFLQERGIQLHPRDRVIPERGTLLGRHTRIDVQKAFEVVVVDGNKLSFIMTPVVPVREMLAAEGFELGPFDRIEPAGLEEVYEGAFIKIIRVQKHYVSSRSNVPYEEVVRENPQLDRGLSRVIREGRPGLQEELIEVTTENGVEVKREIVGTLLLEEPQARIVEQGTNTTLEREGRVMEFERVLTVTATAYCPGTPGSGCPLDRNGHAFCTGPYNNGYTYTGKKAVQGLGTLSSPRLVAVDPRVIPLGSLLYIEPIPGIGKIGFARAEDIGGAIKGYRIDLLYDYHRDVAKFGLRRGVKVYILKEK